MDLLQPQSTILSFHGTVRTILLVVVVGLILRNDVVISSTDTAAPGTCATTGSSDQTCAAAAAAAAATAEDDTDVSDDGRSRSTSDESRGTDDIYEDVLQKFPHATEKFRRLWDGDDLDDEDDDWTMWYLMESLGCPSVNFDGPKDATSYRHIPTPDRTYRHMYRAYHEVMKSSPPSSNSLGPAYQHPFLVETEVRVVPNAGRGVFATQNIPNGTMIWQVSNGAEFPTVDHYYNFLMLLYVYDVARYHERQQDGRSRSPATERFVPEFVCDAILWSYTVTAGLTKEDGYMICIDFDEGSLINQADEEEQRNAVESVLDENDPMSHYGCRRGVMYSMRDIPKGEEIRVNYHDALDPEGWEALGLSW